MPRLPQGMFHRPGRGYYVRLFRSGKERWVALGQDFNKACRRLREVRGGPFFDKVLVSVAAKKWLETYVRTSRSERNQKLTARRVELYLLPFLGPCQLGAVTAEDLRRYRVWLEGRVALQTVSHLLSDARCFCNWCESSGLIQKSPFPRKLLPRIQERPPDRLSGDQVEAVSWIREPYGFYVRFALATGLRWGELVRARREDVTNGVLVVHQTKSGKVRRVPLTKDIQNELRLRVGQLVPYSEKAVGSFNRMVSEEAGFKFHAHQLRHTFACLWLERGGSLAALQQILGHSSIVTTQRYAKLGDDLVQAEAERVENRSQPRSQHQAEEVGRANVVS
jgi:integrase